MADSDKTNNIRSVFSAVLRNWSTLLCFEMFYRGVGFLVFFPLLRYLLSLLPGLTGVSYLGQNNIHLILYHPPALSLLLAILLLAGLYIYFEIAALFLYGESGWKREALSVWSLWKKTAVKVVCLLRPKCLPVFLLLPAMILSVFSVASGYLRKIQIPEFFMEFLAENPLLWGLFTAVTVLIHLILFFYIFGFPVLLFEKTSFRESWRKSLALLKRQKLVTFARITSYSLIFFASLGIFFLAVTLFLAVSILPFHSHGESRDLFELNFLSFQNIWTIVSGALTSVFLCTTDVVLYHRARGDIRPEVQKKHPSFGWVLKRSTVIAATFIMLILFSESEIGGVVRPAGETVTGIVAHRAGAAFAPENTLAALEQAVKDGASIAEIDVQQIRDGSLIVMHDTNFKRTTGTDLNVWDAGFTEVQQLDAGSCFSSRFAGEPIPTLDDMLLASKGKIVLMIELKSTGRDDGIVEKTLAAIDKFHMRDQCMIASMDMELLKEAKDLAPNIKTVYISVLLLTDRYDLREVDAYSLETTSVSPAFVVQAHLQGKMVYAWTANSSDTMERILHSGVDGLITDNVLLADFCIGETRKNRLMNEISDLFFP